MKKLLVILFLLICHSVFPQIDYNLYIGKTKKEIIHCFKEDEVKYNVQIKLFVDIDSTGNWKADNYYYTWLIYYSDIKGLFTFDNKTNICVRYYLLCNDLNKYWIYYEYYNEILIKDNKEMTWIEKRHKYYTEINLKALNSSQFQIFGNMKKY